MAIHSSIVKASGGELTREYESLDGTSMAAPHVAAALALLHQAAPDLSVAERVEVLKGIRAADQGLPQRGDRAAHRRGSSRGLPPGGQIRWRPRLILGHGPGSAATGRTEGAVDPDHGLTVAGPSRSGIPQGDEFALGLALCLGGQER